MQRGRSARKVSKSMRDRGRQDALGGSCLEPKPAETTLPSLTDRVYEGMQQAPAPMDEARWPARWEKRKHTASEPR
jgi:hypothetical protein